ncbi:MAG: DUF4198 domain-containing protein [Acidobacteria bacterium]|nr:DUF4198 domain-containing protein [Acidobacteriota bacterium]
MLQMIYCGLVFLLLGAGTFVQAHDTWIRPEKARVETGDTINLTVSSGHHFPDGGDSVPRDDFRAWLISPSGTEYELTLADAGKSQQGTFVVTERGRHLVYFEHTPGILSKTTKGWVPGDRNAHPEAIRSIYFYSSGAGSFLAGSDSDPRRLPVTLKFHLAAHVVDDQVTLTARLDGKPLTGLEIRKITPSGSSPAGTTDELGRVVLVAPDWRGDILFSAHYNRRPADPAAGYDQENYHTTLVIHF